MVLLKEARDYRLAKKERIDKLLAPWINSPNWFKEGNTKKFLSSVPPFNPILETIDMDRAVHERELEANEHAREISRELELDSDGEVREEDD